MAANHKLAAVIQGRKIASAAKADGKLILGFDDGSAMTVKTASNTDSAAATAGKTVKAVLQAGTTLDLDFEDGSTLTIVTAEPTSSVMVRDKDHALEYAD